MPALGGTTALLLLCVFTVVNIAVLVLRRDRVEHEPLPHADLPADPGRAVLRVPGGAVDRAAIVQYQIAGVLLAIGVVLWVVTMLVNRKLGVKPAQPEMDALGGMGPVN